ncbi:hypothetical protein HA466_0057100 [Hirschfeldia incana]|nr:hypothetical protein HA466_0057100 [Hirschfeldia incana]
MGWWRKKNKEEADVKQKLVQENGEVVLENLIEYCNGKSNPVKTFSASQILGATDNFSSSNSLVLHASGSYQCYRGMLEDRPVLVKKWVRKYSPCSGKTCSDIAISSMVSGHKNFLKLLELVEDGGFVGIIDPKVLESCKEEETWRFKTFFILSLRCIGCIGEVPKMIEVAKELKRMLV